MKRVIDSLRDYFLHFVDIVFPSNCISCKKDNFMGAKYICVSCLLKLPYTNYWNYSNNPIEKTFWGRVKVESAATLLHFEKGGVVQDLLHSLKYRNKPEVGYMLGSVFGKELLSSSFEKPDLVVPIPIHRIRSRKRGYNQSEWIARGISNVLSVEQIANNTKRHAKTKTQTFKGRFDRWKNVDGAFSIISKEKFRNKHLLVVDDVLTTGATSEAFMQELLKIEGVKVSFVALASA